MKIEQTHPDVSAMEDRWARLRAFADGTDAVKAAGRQFLPKPRGLSTDEYAAYVSRAEVPAVVQRTVAGLSGLVFSKPLQVEAPASFDSVLEDADLADSSFDTLAHDALQEILTVGRHCIVTDYSSTENRPYFKTYHAEDIRTWYETRIDGNVKLVRLVLREEGFTPQMETVSQYREYFIDGSGSCFVRMWTKVNPKELKSTRAKYEAGPVVALTRRGDPLDFIPAVVYSATRIGTDVEVPPLLPLADAAQSSYAVSADYRHALYGLVPTVWVASEEARNSTEPLSLGPSVVWTLEPGSSVGLIAMKGADIQPFREYLNEKRSEMASLGARLLESQPASAETFGAVQLRHSSEFATLRTVGLTLQQALSTSLQTAVWWDGTGDRPEDVSVTVNRDFFNVRSSPAEVKNLVEAYTSGAISYSVLFDNLQRGGVVPANRSEKDELTAIYHHDTPAPPPVR